MPPDLGARHAEQQVNTTTAGDQEKAKTVELSDGTYVTAWGRWRGPAWPAFRRIGPMPWARNSP
ncbi:MAG: hypothetical protein WDN06_15330 [Asticcacaulis sp.]